MSTSGMSRVSLRDSGPLDSSANFGRDYSEASLRSRTESDGASSLGTNAGPRPAYLTAFGDDLRPNRESIVSLRELEAGWSSHPSGLNARKSQRHPAAQHDHRPAFAPSAQLDGAVEGQQPHNPPAPPHPPMGPGAHKNANQASESDWNTPKRGRSIKERITNAIGRSKSHGARPGPSSRRLSHGSINSDDEQELNIAKAKSGTEEDEHEDSYYSVPNQDANKPHPSTANGGVGSSTTVKAAPSGASKEPGHGLMRKLSRKETRAARQPDPAPPKPAQSEIDKIRLYAAPDSAGVKNAPMLSSFPPRAPLRPRANTDAKDQPHEPQVPSMTVGDARLAYTKSLSRNNHRHRGGRPANSSNVAPPPYRKEGETLRPAVADEDVLSMRSARSRGSSTINGTRRSRAVPEGWATGESLLETQEQGQKGTKVQFE